MVEASASVPCTCGELFQGTLDGRPCLVSCPIDRYSTARVTAGGGAAGAKVRTALAKSALPEGISADVAVQTPLPVGRGYGTSTADIGAALFAVAESAGFPLDGLEASRIAVSVEPTDSTLLEGLALLDHRQGRFHEYLGRAPRLVVMVLDPGGIVDTELFNAEDRSAALKPLEPEHRRAYELLRWGIARGDGGAVGEAATLSARLHQPILRNVLLDAAVEAGREAGALGVCRAHSGTLIGLLFDPRTLDVERAGALVAERFPGVGRCFASLVDGGARRTPA